MPSANTNLNIKQSRVIQKSSKKRTTALMLMPTWILTCLIIFTIITILSYLSDELNNVKKSFMPTNISNKTKKDISDYLILTHVLLSVTLKNILIPYNYLKCTLEIFIFVPREEYMASSISLYNGKADVYSILGL